MNRNSKSDDELVQRFVDAARRIGEVAMGKPVIQASDQPDDWIEAVEQRAGLVFPSLYYLFATRFQFPEFEVGGIMFFATAPNQDENEIHVRDKILRDPGLYPTCLSNGYLQFGNPFACNYDPVCFDTKFRKSREDCPIVQLDHEEILIYERIKIIKVIAPSMRAFMEKAIASV
ncbi:SMI1/KNR4 family protein [bacterium]|nr:SMI1/KNR4 family protein [bacterium]